MSFHRCGLAVLGFLALLPQDGVMAQGPSGGGAVLYVGATFLTQDETQPRAQALLVTGGKIRQVFATRPKTTPPGARVVDLGGGVVVPGLHDAHAHLSGVGQAQETLALEGTRSAAQVVERVRARLEEQPTSFLVGRGWDQNDWDCAKPKVSPCGGEMPSRQLLDAVAPDTPVVLRRVDGHAAWVNTAALQRGLEAGGAALQNKGVDPHGGRILREKNGDASGVLVDTAMDLVTQGIPAPTPEVLQARLKAGADAAARTGLTAVHEMGASLAELEAGRALDRRGELAVRWFVYLDGSEKGVLEALPAGGIQRPEGRVEVRGIKLYADGALGSRGAALLQPYSDEKDTSGLLVTAPKILEDTARAAHDKGFQVAIHAIGDRANREVLQLYGRLANARARRHRVEHAQVVDPADFGRFAATGAIASMQPTHCTSDMPWAQKRLGPARLKGAYAWQALTAADAHLAFGSDAPVEDIRPLWGLYAAVTRMDHTGAPAGGFTPAQKMSGTQALEGFTHGAAYAVGHEDELGIFKEGATADMTWLSDDPTTVPPSMILSITVRGRMMSGVLERFGP